MEHRIASVIEAHPSVGWLASLGSMFLGWLASLGSMFLGWLAWFIEHVGDFAQFFGLVAGVFGMVAGYYTMRIQRRAWKNRERHKS